MSRAHRGLLSALCMLAPLSAFALETSIRLKWFGSADFLPAHDIQRQSMGTPAFDMGGDMRLMVRQNLGAVKLLADHSTTFLSGDSHAFANALETSLDQTPTDDDTRVMNLTHTIEDGDRHRSLHRLDRLALQYRTNTWAVTLGRQAVTWGNGMVFSPMDLLSPFAPTVVDQDYKAGDDLLLFERVFSNGNDLQVLAVGRRAATGEFTGAAGSAAMKWHAFIGESEVEILAAKHYRDRVLGLSGRLPLGGAMLRFDAVVTRLDDGRKKTSGIINLDYSISLGDDLAYVFAEYYRNGFGVADMPGSVARLPEPLRTRLARGELFNIMRDYAAVGVSVPWHPLLSQSLTLLSNLNDASSLLQTSIVYEPGDHQRLQVGLVMPLGRAGDEFGGIPVVGNTSAGGGTKFFLRWLHYF